MMKNEKIKLFLKCLLFGPVLGVVVTFTHFLTTALFSIISTIFSDFSLGGSVPFAAATAFFVGYTACYLVIPFSLILFALSLAKGFKPRLGPTVYFTVYGVAILDFIDWVLIYLMESLFIIIYFISVILVFIGCLRIAFDTAEQMENSRE